MAKIVSRTYGEALFEAAMEAGPDQAALLAEEIAAVREILSQNPEFDALMNHPAVPKQEKLQVVGSVFRGRISDELESFLEVIVSKDRYRELDAVFGLPLR